MDIVQFIAAKRDGQEHSPGELARFIAAGGSGEAADYQLAAWLMAAYLRGLSTSETVAAVLAERSRALLARDGIFNVRDGVHRVGELGGVGLGY